MWTSLQTPQEGGGGNHIVEKCSTGILKQGRLGGVGGIPLLAPLLAQQFAPKISLCPQLEEGEGGQRGLSCKKCLKSLDRISKARDN